MATMPFWSQFLAEGWWLAGAILVCGAIFFVVGPGLDFNGYWSDRD